MPSERLSEHIEEGVERLLNKWLPEPCPVTRLRVFRSDLRRFARMVEKSQADVHTEDAQGERYCSWATQVTI